jgi:hypothetical protein
MIVEKCAADLVRRAVHIVTESGFPQVVVSVGAIKIDKGVEIKIEAQPTIENITKLAEHGKSSAILVLAEASEFVGARSTVEPDKDQPDLDLKDEAA